MSREYFCAYHSLLQSMEPLNDAERGRLFMACLEYSKSGVAPELRGNERFVFPTIKGQIDRDAMKYETKSQALSENGKKGGRPKKQTEAEKANGFSESKKSQDKDKDKDKDKKDKNTLGDFFETLWAAYPKKKGKGGVSDTQKRKLHGIGLEEMLRCVERYKNQVARERTEDRYVKHGSTFFNSGYVDYLDKNYAEAGPDGRRDAYVDGVYYDENGEREEV